MFCFFSRLPAFFASTCTLSSISLTAISIQNSPEILKNIPNPGSKDARLQQEIEERARSASYPPYVRVFKEKNGREIHLVGTCHVLQKSAVDALKVIKNVKPDIVLVELDRSRAAALLAPSKIDKVQQKQEDVLAHILQKIYSTFEKKSNYIPGFEFRMAIHEARKQGAQIILGDRDVQITMQRMQYSLLKNLPRLLFSSPQKYQSEIDAFVVIFRESLKPGSYPPHMLDYSLVKLSRWNTSSPILAGLVSERDQYMASFLQECGGDRVVAVVGMAHVDGIIKILENAEETKLKNTKIAHKTGAELRSQLDVLPSKVVMTSLFAAYASVPLAALTTISLSVKKFIFRSPITFLSVATHFSAISIVIFASTFLVVRSLRNMRLDLAFDSIEKLEHKKL